MSMGVWRRVVNTRGDPWCGRPARYARRQTIVGLPPFTYIPCCLLTSKMCQDICHLLTHTCRSRMTPTYHPPSTLALTLATHPIPPIYVHASTDTYGRASSAGVFCDEVVGVLRHPSKPTLVNAAQGPVLSNARPYSDKSLDHQPITSQCCVAMSVDIRSAVARFLGRCHRYIRTGYEYPRVL